MWLLLNLTTVQANTDHFNDFQKAIQQVKQEYHSHSEVGGGGVELPTKFSKREAWQDLRF